MQIAAHTVRPAAFAPAPVLDNPEFVSTLTGTLSAIDKVSTSLGAIESSASYIAVSDPLLKDVSLGLTQSVLGLETIAASTREPFNTSRVAADSARVGAHHLTAALDLIKAAQTHEASLPVGHEMFVGVDAKELLAHVSSGIKDGVEPMIQALGLTES